MKPAFAISNPDAGLLSTRELDEKILRRLFRGEVLAIEVVDAVGVASAGHIVRRITGSARLAGYAVEPSFKKIEAAWFDHQTDEARAEHLSRTKQYITGTRSLCAPFPAPTDTLVCDLAQAWPAGVANLRIGGKPLYHGLPRALPPGGEVHAHFDWIGSDSPGAPGIEKLRHQYALNFYIQPADAGGELALWSTGLSPAELMTLRIPGHAYALDEAKLGAPALVIRPEPRSMIIFNACQPHAVRMARGSIPRVAFSCFLGFAGEDQPLKLWS